MERYADDRLMCALENPPFKECEGRCMIRDYLTGEIMVCTHLRLRKVL